MKKKLSINDRAALEDILWHLHSRIASNKKYLELLETDIQTGEREKDFITESQIESYKYSIKKNTAEAQAVNNALHIAGVGNYQFIEGKPKKMKFKGDIIITDPCYIMRAKHRGITDDDWEACEYGQNMEVLGIKNYLTENTIYGDWSCTTYNAKTRREIGRFCADAGLVSVFLLDEVLKYNPDFNFHTEKPWTTTLIKNFDGEVEIKPVKIKTKDGYKYEEVRVIGKSKNGEKDFFTKQTGI